MSERKLRYLTNTPNQIVFSDPQHINNQFAITRELKSKRAGELRVNNVRTTLSDLRTIPVLAENCEIGCTPNTERVGVTLVITGSVENKVAIKQQISDLFANVLVAIESGSLAGYPVPFDTNFKFDVGVA